VSVEDQAAADERIPLLLQTPAAVRWISAEPLLGPVESAYQHTTQDDVDLAPDHGGGYEAAPIGWVVVGGESGPGARPMHPDWARSLRNQCDLARCAVLLQAVGRPPARRAQDATTSASAGRTAAREWYGDHQDIKYGEHWLSKDEEKLVIAWPTPKKHAGRELDGRTHDEYPA
jgi:protein gp37